jgi:hypothetical protein
MTVLDLNCSFVQKPRPTPQTTSMWLEHDHYDRTRSLARELKERVVVGFKDSRKCCSFYLNYATYSQQYHKTQCLDLNTSLRTLNYSVRPIMLPLLEVRVLVYRQPAMHTHTQIELKLKKI